jgi:hypothetical protein
MGADTCWTGTGEPMHFGMAVDRVIQICGWASTPRPSQPRRGAQPRAGGVPFTRVGRHDGERGGFGVALAPCF